MIVVTPKINPDLDGYACSLAYTELLKKKGRKAIGISAGQIQREVEFLNKEFGFEPMDERFAAKGEFKELKDDVGIAKPDIKELKGDSKGFKDEFKSFKNEALTG